MGDPLRDRRPLRELADNQQVIEISESIGSFERLARVVEADLAALDAQQRPADWQASAVTGQLRFGSSGREGDTARLEGRLSVNLPATCQRCLQPFAVPLVAELAFDVVAAGSDAVAVDGVETWELDERTVRPIDIADEALVMALPLVAMHAEGSDCANLEPARSGEDTTTPFASLRAQLDAAGED